MVRLSAFTTQEIFLVLICVSADGKIMSMQNSDDTIQGRTQTFRLVAQCLNQLLRSVSVCLARRGILRSNQLLYNFIVTNDRTRVKGVLIV
jgi:hypothetical protein